MGWVMKSGSMHGGLIDWGNTNERAYRCVMNEIRQMKGQSNEHCFCFKVTKFCACGGDAVNDWR